MLQTIRSFFYQISQFIWFLIVVMVLIIMATECHKHRPYKQHTPPSTYTKKICLNVDNSFRARHKTCFLRPDTGPCRADILQWYFDVRQRTCYRFFWGGCQGNGNRFESYEDCHKFCFLNTTAHERVIPHYCYLAFDYGTCFGYYNRWTFDKLSKTCRRRLYSGCGGNQNNFQTREECTKNCIAAPNNTLQRYHTFTTCVPLDIPELL